MARFSAVRRTMLALPLAFLAACSGDGPTAPEANLTAEELADVYSALSVLNELSFGGFLRAGGEPSAVMAALTESINETSPCPQGGSTRIAGSISINETTFASTTDIRQYYTDCGVTSESARLWVFNGDPNIRTRMSSTYNAQTDQLSLTGSLTGAFKFRSNGDSGRCSINLSITLGSTSVTIAGTICGQPYNETVPFV